MDIEHLPSMGLLTILCDNMLFEAGGGQRELNYNSRPISLVSKELEAVALWARNPEVEDVRIDPHARYIGTNWAAIEKFGTAEFRHFPGCSDPKLLIWWTNLLCRMYSHAEAHSIDELMEISVEGHKALGRAVFGGDYAKLESARAADDWYATMEAAIQATNQGIDGFLTKPFDNIELRAKIHSISVRKRLKQFESSLENVFQRQSCQIASNYGIFPDH